MTSQTDLTSNLHYTDMMLEHIYVGVAVFDARDFRMLEANKVFYDFSKRFGQDPEKKKQLIGQRLSDHNPILKVMGVDEIFRSVVETGTPYRARELPYPSSNGDTYWNWGLVPVSGEDGQVTHLVLTLADVTDQVKERQRAEEERQRLSQAKRLAETERKLLEVIETVARSVSESLDPKRIGTIALDAIGTHFNALTCCLHMADAAHQILRLLCERSPSNKAPDIQELTIIPYEQSSFAKKAIVQRTSIIMSDVQVAASEGCIGAQHPLVRLGVRGYVCTPLWYGDVFEGTLCAGFEEPIQMDSAEVRTLDGISAHIAAALAHARLHTAVKNERSRLNAILDQIPEGILLAEVFHGTISYANPAAASLLGIPLSQLIGLPLHEQSIINRYTDSMQDDMAHLPPWNFLVIRALCGESVTSRETLVVRSDGSKAVTLTSSAPLCTEQGIMTGAMIVFQDVTAQKTLEQHKNEFLSVANHELRTPITIIQGFAEILQLQNIYGTQPPSLDPMMQSALVNITEQSLQLTHLIEEMLDITRIEQSQFMLQRAPRDLLKLLELAIESQKITTRQHTFELILEELPASQKLVGFIDEKRITQVLHNLIGNAIKYSPSGGHIEIGLRFLCEQHQALIWVKDQGIGVSPDEIPLIFKRFHRANNQDRALSGFGIGLYLVKEVVTRHGGRVWVESMYGKGSTFYISLPLSPPA